MNVPDTASHAESRTAVFAMPFADVGSIICASNGSSSVRIRVLGGGYLRVELSGLQVSVFPGPEVPQVLSGGPNAHDTMVTEVLPSGDADIYEASTTAHLVGAPARAWASNLSLATQRIVTQEEVKGDGLLAQARSEVMPAVMAMLASQESVAEKRRVPWILPWISACMIVVSYVMNCMELHPLMATPWDEGSTLMATSLELYRLHTPPATEFLAKREEWSTLDMAAQVWVAPLQSISVVSTPWWTWTQICLGPIGGAWLPNK